VIESLEVMVRAHLSRVCVQADGSESASLSNLALRVLGCMQQTVTCLAFSFAF